MTLLPCRRLRGFPGKRLRRQPNRSLLRGRLGENGPRRFPLLCGVLTDVAFAAVTPYVNSGGVPAVRSPIVRPAAHQISRYGLPMVFAAPLSFESITSSVRFKSFVFATAFSASHCRTIDQCNALLTRPQTTRHPALLRERRVVFYYGKDTYFPALGRVYGFYALGGYAAFLFRAGRILPA